MSVRFAPLSALLLPVIAMLSACDGAAPVADEEAARAASGEVLEGSISDDMLPLATLRSQPPVAAPLPGEVVAAPAGPDGAQAADAPAADAATAEPATAVETEAAPAQ